MYCYYEYQVILFSLSNTRLSFQEYINKIFPKKWNIFVIVELANILLQTKDCGLLHMNVIYYVLKQLIKHSFFTYWKKLPFLLGRDLFSMINISAQGISTEEERMEAVKTWPKPKYIWEINVFLRFANFYRCLIEAFSCIVLLLTSILKTTSY